MSYVHKTDIDRSVYTNPIVHPTIIVKTEILKKFLYREIPFAEDYELYQRLFYSGIKLDNIHKNLIKYNRNIKNIKNYKRAFYVILSTTIISNAFRNNNIVNHNFFKRINLEKNFRYSYDKYAKNYLFNKKFSKYLYLIYFLIFGNDLLRKNIRNRFLYFFKKLIFIRKNL